MQGNFNVLKNSINDNDSDTNFLRILTLCIVVFFKQLNLLSKYMQDWSLTSDDDMYNLKIFSTNR